MYKRFISAVIFITLLFSTSYKTLAASSPQDSIVENKLKLQQLNDKIMNSNAEISNLNSQMSKLNSTIKKNNDEILECQKQIKASEAQKEQLSSDIENSQKLLGKRVRAMYMINSNGSYLSMLLTAKNISDFLFRMETVQRIISFDKKLLNELEGKRQELYKIITDLDSKNQQLQLIKNQNAANLQQLTSKKTELEALIKEFDTQKQAAAQIIAENEEKLISHSISVINSQSPSISEMKGALDTLKSLIPQLSTASVKKKAEDYVAEGNKKLVTLIANSAKQNNGDDNGSFTYKAVYTMTATAYTGHSLTALGLKPVRDPAGLSTIAVDPDVLPLGSKVYIPGYGYAICADTGGSINGNKIDLFLDSESECLSWGVRSITLYLIAYPGEW